MARDDTDPYQGHDIGCIWRCEDCGWTCPPTTYMPLREAECDNCGGELVEIEA